MTQSKTRYRIHVSQVLQADEWVGMAFLTGGVAMRGLTLFLCIAGALFIVPGLGTVLWGWYYVDDDILNTGEGLALFGVMILLLIPVMYLATIFLRLIWRFLLSASKTASEKFSSCRTFSKGLILKTRKNSKLVIIGCSCLFCVGIIVVCAPTDKGNSRANDSRHVRTEAAVMPTPTPEVIPIPEKEEIRLTTRAYPDETGSAVVVENNDDFVWEKVLLRIIVKGETDSTKDNTFCAVKDCIYPTGYEIIPFSSFRREDGTVLDAQKQIVLSILIQAKTPQGIGAGIDILMQRKPSAITWEEAMTVHGSRSRYTVLQQNKGTSKNHRDFAFMIQNTVLF